MPLDLLILSNGPGELATWVRPVLQALRAKLGQDRSRVRISLVLSPCPNATGREVAIAQRYPELDRIQAAAHFFPFLLWGKTAENWDWGDRGVVLFLGGDQFYPVIIGKRLGYRTVLYGEWETRWHDWIDRFAVMNAELASRAPARYAHKFSVIGDLMADVDSGANMRGDSAASALLPDVPALPNENMPLVGLLPGSKPAKLAQGVPLGLAIAQQIHAARPDVQFVIPVAPTLDLDTLARFADPAQNAIAHYFGAVSARLLPAADPSGPFPAHCPSLKTESGLQISLWTPFPAYDLLQRCQLCLTTVGANTAELGALAVPMIVFLPTQQLDAMRAWDGIPGLLANLPGVGGAIAKLINGWFLRKSRLLAWPNIWAGEAIVPELVGNLKPEDISTLALDWLEHPETRDAVRDRLRRVRGKPGAAEKLAEIVVAELGIQE
ncbi:lipid-A-disaccharide synthase [Thermoleptolyngbya oregonensis NK1-22]|uniref:Lipid-A-disaccharide synthase n=1 Tax=Thermoleptolyngbya oregonensis NK1-22 TaxID=2547457 RepID=A0AA97BE77_9CYAN|nr:lipid-A-disaccharide synthase [Thermoleptolyngbya oregonensis]WOB45354.1 lipid-A-disaccharide synthase [Thermoleptolyngbya oregonensis NK1-22]